MKSDVIIIGTGAVGLATAVQLLKSKPGLRIRIIDKETEIARHQTGNNSNVIHSGIYYKPGSLKAKNCIHGYNLLLDFCTRNNIPFNLCGKVIVATSEAEVPLLSTIYNRGVENGLTGLRMIDKPELLEIEPHVNGLKAIFVPQTGIVDYKQVAITYGTVAQEAGAELNLGEKVLDIKKVSTGVEVVTDKGTYQSKLVVTCGGLQADKLAAMTLGKVSFRIIPFRGEYYKLKPEREHLCKTLIYPVPDPNFPFLGVHFTTMINGGVECGPNAVFAFKREGYKRTDFNLADVAESLAWPGFRKVIGKYWKTGLGEFYRSFSKPAFTKALQRLIPEIREEDLIPGGAGVRAQACDYQGGLIDDFLILEDGPAIHVCNAPSPAATSSLAIGEHIAGIVLPKL